MNLVGTISVLCIQSSFLARGHAQGQQDMRKEGDIKVEGEELCRGPILFKKPPSECVPHLPTPHWLILYSTFGYLPFSPEKEDVKWPFISVAMMKSDKGFENCRVSCQCDTSQSLLHSRRGTVEGWRGDAYRGKVSMQEVETKVKWKRYIEGLKHGAAQ